MNIEQMEAMGVDPTLIENAKKGYDTVNGRVDPKTEVLDESGEVIENNVEEETVEGVEEQQTDETNTTVLDDNNDVSDEEAEQGAQISDDKEESEEQEKEEVQEGDYSLESLYKNMDENNGQLGEEVRADLKERFKKAGIPQDLVERFEKLEKMNANLEIKEMLSVLGTKEERQEVFAWAKEARKNDSILDRIVKDYNEAAKSRSIDKAKEYATILKDYHSRTKSSNAEQPKKPITLTGNSQKATPKKTRYDNAEEMQSDLRKMAHGEKVDFNDIVNKAIAAKIKK